MAPGSEPYSSAIERAMGRMIPPVRAELEGMMAARVMSECDSA